MPNITLICTIHKENGNCSLYNLVNIIECINPEVIFEEISYTRFTEEYPNQGKEILEIQAIKKCLKDKYICLVDVDKLGLSEYQDRNFNDILTNVDRINPKFRELIQHQHYLESINGFRLLNSIENNKLITKIEKTIIETKDKSIQSKYKTWINCNNDREIMMIANIYKYSIQHKYNRALFLVGSGHRNSIIKNIQEYKKSNTANIKWRFNSYKNIF